MGVIVQLKKLFTDVQIFPKTKSNAVYDDELGRLDSVMREEIPQMTDPEEEFGEEDDLRDADTLGGVSADEYAKKTDYGSFIIVLLTENWVEQEDGTFVYKITQPNLTGDELLDVSLYDDGSATQEQVETFNEVITEININAGEIELVALTRPTVSLSIVFKGLCNIDDSTVVNLAEVIEKYDEVQKELDELNNNFETQTLSFDDVFTIPTDTVSNIVVEDCAIIKRGKHIWVDIGFKGSITSGAGGNTTILKINPKYAPLRNFSIGVMINGVTSGQIYKPATLFTSARQNVNVVFPEHSKQYGNDSYPWSTSSWLKFNWEI